MSEAIDTPARLHCRSHSLRRGRKVTSIRLENAFWDVLRDIADRRGLTLNQLIAETVDGAAPEVGTITNQASLLRVACLGYLQEPDGEHRLAGGRIHDGRRPQGAGKIAIGGLSAAE